MHYYNECALQYKLMRIKFYMENILLEILLNFIYKS